MGAPNGGLRSLASWPLPLPARLPQCLNMAAAQRQDPEHQVPWVNRAVSRGARLVECIQHEFTAHIRPTGTTHGSWLGATILRKPHPALPYDAHGLSCPKPPPCRPLPVCSFQHLHTQVRRNPTLHPKYSHRRTQRDSSMGHHTSISSHTPPATVTCYPHPSHRTSMVMAKAQGQVEGCS